MATTAYPTSAWPSDVRTALEVVVPEARDTLGRRYDISPGEIAVDWSATVHHSAEMLMVLLDAWIDEDMAERTHTQSFTKVVMPWKLDGTQKNVVAGLVGLTTNGPNSFSFNDHVRDVLRIPDVRTFFNVASDDDGTHYSVRPVGHDLEGPAVETLALHTRRSKLIEMEPGTRVAVATLAMTYGNEDLAADIFKDDLAMSAGFWAAEVVYAPPNAKRPILMMLADYCGW